MALREILADYDRAPLPPKLMSDLRTRLRLGGNLADLLQEFPWGDSSDPMLPHRLAYLLLSRELNHACLSLNLSSRLPPVNELLSAVPDLKRFNTVVLLHRSGSVPINPVDEKNWQKALPLRPFELVVIYTHRRFKTPDLTEPILLRQLIRFFDGSRADLDLDEGFLPRPSPAPFPHRKPAETTPRYAVMVTNEFFHYGNVEAWQNIIESYGRRYPETKITLYHGGKRISQVAALFRWGKVRVGDTLFFTVTGNEIRDVAKLKKYLTLGASPGFTPFIRKTVNRPLNLF